MVEQIISISAVSFGILLIALSFVGCILPILPGPILAYAGLALLYLTEWHPSTAAAVAGGVAVAVALILDYVVPSLGAKAFKSSKRGVVGCFLGSLCGLLVGTVLSCVLPMLAAGIVTICALFIGPFIGTLVGELMSDKEPRTAFVSAVGSFVGFLFSVVLKEAVCGFVAVLFAWTLFRAWTA